MRRVNSNMAARIALIDDDDALRESIRTYLADVGFDVDAYDGVAAFRAGWDKSVPDVVISDLRMPGEDGIALLTWVRSFSQIPVILLTSIDGATDRVVGLELGADDYLAKPCDLRELLARVRTQLRRLKNMAAAPAAVPVASRQKESWFGRWRLDRARRRLVDADGTECPITGADYALLSVFADHPKVVLSRDKLIELAGIDPAEVFDRAIDMRITRLRKKIEPTPGDPTVIKTVRGHGGGYEYVPADGPQYGR
jgi:DNA-binding response OmpR family regulator